MAYHYVDPSKENDDWTLPNINTWKESAREKDEETDNDWYVRWYGGEGWYFAFGFPGCMNDSEPTGPFETEEEAVEYARDLCGGD